jgi:hypothetical protein
MDVRDEPITEQHHQAHRERKRDTDCGRDQLAATLAPRASDMKLIRLALSGSKRTMS